MPTRRALLLALLVFAYSKPLFAFFDENLLYFPRIIRIEPATNSAATKFLTIQPPQLETSEDEPTTALPQFQINAGSIENGKFKSAKKYSGKYITDPQDPLLDRIEVTAEGQTQPIISILDRGRRIRFEKSQRIQPGTEVASYPINAFSGAELDSKSCFMCQWPLAETVPSRTKSCEDLAKMACSSTNETIPQQLQTFQRELIDTVDRIRSQTAKLLGYKNAEDAVLTNIRKSGFPPVKVLSERAKQYLLTGKIEHFEEPQLVFADSENCHKNLNELITKGRGAISNRDPTPKTPGNSPTATPSSLLSLEEWKVQVSQFTHQQLLRIAKAASLNIPQFVGGFTEKCNEWKSFSPEERKNLIAKNSTDLTALDEVCSNPQALKKHAIQVYRSRGTPNYQIQINEFFKKYFHPRMVNLVALRRHLDFQKLERELEANESKQVAFNIKIQELNEICYNLDDALQSTPRAARLQMNSLISQARPTVEALIDEIYSPERQKTFEKIFYVARNEVYGVARRLTQDPTKLQQIRKGLIDLKLTWLNKPKDEDYSQIPGVPFELFRLEDVSLAPGNPYAEAFTDPTLSYFTDLNAAYSPNIEVGTIRRDNLVTIQPFLLKLFDKNPFGVFTVLAHEVGHSLGPKMSRINNYNLYEDISSALSCYTDPDSINMNNAQADEVMADLVAAQVLASQVSQLPQNRRAQAVLNAMAPLCFVQSLGEDRFEFNAGGIHPDSGLRISGIYGSNPDLRHILTCSPGSQPKEFRSCGL